MKYNVNVQYNIEVDTINAHEAAIKGTQSARWGADNETITNLNISVALPFEYGPSALTPASTSASKEGVS